MGWKWWTKTYFSVFFSRRKWPENMWFSPFFAFLEVLMVIGCFDSKSRFHQSPILYVAMFSLAVAFTTLGMIQASYTHRMQNRFHADLRRRGAAYIEAERKERINQLPKQEEPTVSPWFLGCWENI